MIDVRKLSSHEATALDKIIDATKEMKLDLTEEEKEFISTLSKKVKESIRGTEELRKEIQDRQADFEKQKEENRFKYLCGACSETCAPRCLELYQRKYCSNLYNSSCQARKKNPEY